MIYDDIKNFNEQFGYAPMIENESALVRKTRVIVAGMGGSELASMLMKYSYPEIDFFIHRNYDLPRLGDEKLADSLVIAISYSGNTEETIDAFNTALQKKIPLAVITTGGTLLSLAQQNGIPYIQMPSTGMQPRMALGFSTIALLKMLGKKDVIAEIGALVSDLRPSEYEEAGKQLAQSLNHKIPLIYVSKHDEAIAYVWKIKFNETGKIPAFYNVFPELNHNEMAGFDGQGAAKDLSGNFACILLDDTKDDPRIIKRINMLEQLYQKRGIAVHRATLRGDSRLFRIFSSIVLADWTSYYIAQMYGSEAEQVPMIEEFKKLIA